MILQNHVTGRMRTEDRVNSQHKCQADRIFKHLIALSNSIAATNIQHTFTVQNRLKKHKQLYRPTSIATPMHAKKKIIIFTAYIYIYIRLLIVATSTVIIAYPLEDD